jgi:DNA-binding NarL/FixJ family response regulator
MNGPIRCIVVEDFEPLNNVYCNLLNYEKDIEVVGRAHNSEELFELLKEKAADVILLDIEMKSRTEGIETCKKVIKAYPETQIIMMTCHDEEDIILSAFEAGAVDYVLKTSSSAQILEAVRSAFNNSSAINSYVAFVIRKRMKEFSAFKESLLYLMNIVSSLTASEIDVLKLLLKGKKQREIAEIRSVELVTVKAHVSSILKKFNQERTSEIVKAIKASGLQSFIENRRPGAPG